MSDDRRIVLALQFWAGDREATMRNARRIADNEPAFRNDFEIFFIARFDCEHDRATVDYVSKKFRVTTYTSPRRSTGWPNGCNDLACETFCEAHRRYRSGQWGQVRAVMLMEADCIPVKRDWLDRLTKEWDQTESDGKWLTGRWMDSCTSVGHLNGNCMVHVNLFGLLPQIAGSKANLAWDVCFAKMFEPHWRRAEFIENLYSQTNLSRERAQSFVDAGFVILHGLKDLSSEEFADSVLRK